MSLASIPIALRIAAPAAEPSYTSISKKRREYTLTDSVLAQQAVVGVLRGAGVATAKRGRARTEKAVRRENILDVVKLQKDTCKASLLRSTTQLNIVFYT